MEHWRAVVGGNVKRLRDAAGWSQERLAHDVGIDLKYMGGIERGQRNPSLKVIVRIAEVFGVTPADMLTPFDGHVRQG